MRQSLANSTALVHHFTRGMRFDTEVQYRQLSAKASRWHDMPITLSAPTEESTTTAGAIQPDSAQLCLAQCLSVLGHPGLKLVEPGPPPQLDDANSLAYWLKMHGLALGAQLWWSAAPQVLGLHALKSIQSGSTCAVCVESAHWRRWVWLAGVEILANARQPKPRALLVLDACGSPPWACGHNARIELKNQVRANPPDKLPSLIYRHLDGKATDIRMLGMIALCD